MVFSWNGQSKSERRKQNLAEVFDVSSEYAYMYVQP